MLQHLSVRNIVLIESLDISFQPGFCALTGETGSGKSILLDALGAVLGSRAEARLVRNGAEQGSVTAVFDIAGLPAVHATLAELALEHEEDELRLRRVLTKEGKSRAFINDIPVSVSALKQVGETLLEMHGQHDQRGLMDAATHRLWLDAFGRLLPQAASLQAAYKDWRQAEKDVKTAAETLAKLKQEEEYLRHVVAELNALAPTAGEEEQLAERRRQLMQFEKLAGSLIEALARLEESDGAQMAVTAIERSLWRVDAEAVPSLPQVTTALEKASHELEQARLALQEAVRETEFDAEEQNRVEERLFALREAARKHQCTPDELASRLAQYQQQLQELDAQDRFAAERQARLNATRAAYVTQAEQLAALRTEAATHLQQRMQQELAPLKMEKARFVVEQTPLPEPQWSGEGMQAIQFLIAANPGSPPGPLGKIASGGELSRFMLALKVALSEVKTVPCLVFDEVDTGVGGAVATAIGSRLALLADAEKGSARQVFVVTHQPQVAAFANQHVKVSKDQQDDSTHTRITLLDAAARREELARMLAGDAITDAARAAADALLQRNVA